MVQDSVSKEPAGKTRNDLRTHQRLEWRNHGTSTACSSVTICSLRACWPRERDMTKINKLKGCFTRSDSHWNRKENLTPKWNFVYLYVSWIFFWWWRKAGSTWIKFLRTVTSGSKDQENNGERRGASRLQAHLNVSQWKRGIQDWIIKYWIRYVKIMYVDKNEIF